jgi:phage baseplate assembly protein W
MAYNARKISPLDLRPSTGIGVSIPFSALNVFNTVYSTKDQTKYNLINFLLTDPRERPFNPNFGAGLRSFLFEQLETNTTDDLQTMLISQIESNFPNVNIVSLLVTSDVNIGAINIEFSYNIRNTKESDEVLLTIQNV